MKEIRWNLLKSERLKKTRGVSFEEILQAKMVAVKRHPILNTLYPSRQLTKIYRKEGKL